MSPDELRTECPQCGKQVVRSCRSGAPFFPFCCERCKLLDLGKWLSGEHRIEEPLEPGSEDPSGRSAEN